MPVADLEDVATRASAIACDASRPASERVAELRRLDATVPEDDTEVRGQIEHLSLSLELQREAEALVGAHEALLARENADIREELLNRDAATPEELDAAGFFSHEALDAKTADGTLQEAFGMIDPALLRKIAAKRHRDHGKFADEFSSLAAPKKLRGRGGAALPAPPKPPQAPRPPGGPRSDGLIGMGKDALDAMSKPTLGEIRPTVHVPPKPSTPKEPVHGEFASDAGTKEKPIKVGGDVQKAAQLLAQGHHVELEQPHQVSTLLDELAKMVKEAEAAGDKAPSFNLCKVSVPGTNLFCADTKGYGRLEMPQLGGDPIPGSKAAALPKNINGEVDLAPAFRKHLEDQGVRVHATSMPASHMRASQGELNGAKTAAIAASIRKNGGLDASAPPLFVSSDDYIVDGHHRWAATVGVDAADGHLGDDNLDALQVDMPITELLGQANDFSAAMGIAPKGMNTPSEPRTPEPKPPAEKLTDNHSLYIQHDPKKHPVVDVSSLQRSKPDQPDSVAEAIRRMNKAAAGDGSKRKPIDVHDNGDGTYKVIDGNATTEAAQRGGLSKMPVNIVSKSEPAAAGAKSGAVMPDPFTEEETSKPEQNFGTVEEMFAAAKEALPGFTSLLTEGVGADIGASAPASIEEAVSNAETHPETPQVVMGPLKKMDRSMQKINGKYGGDHNRLQDVVRATVVVPKLADMPAMVEALRKHAEKSGYTIRKAENRYLDPPPPHNVGPTPSGYRDAAIALVSPNGVVTELQMNTAPMFLAKQGEGHTMYEESRQIEAEMQPKSPGTAGGGGGAPGVTPEKIARLHELERLSTDLYDRAYEASIG